MQHNTSILVLNGPNLNLLGSRETNYYGNHSFDQLHEMCQQTTDRLGYNLLFFQSNIEGELINQLHDFGKLFQSGNGLGVVFNPGAYSHTSIALHDAIEALKPMPVIECHISNIYARDSFRHHSWISSVSVGQIVGLGVAGYVVAIEALVRCHAPHH